MSSPLALHSKKTPKWGTPSWLIELARQLLDSQIHLDPASSPEFNTIVKALMIYTQDDNGLKCEWGGNVFLNPPGGQVTEFWSKLCENIANGCVQKAFFVGFSVEQLCTLGDCKSHPLDFSVCILRKRVCFTQESLQPGGSPSHGNFIVAMGCDKELFTKLFSKLGYVSHGSMA